MPWRRIWEVVAGDGDCILSEFAFNKQTFDFDSFPQCSRGYFNLAIMLHGDVPLYLICNMRYRWVDIFVTFILFDPDHVLNYLLYHGVKDVWTKLFFAVSCNSVGSLYLFWLLRYDDGERTLMMGERWRKNFNDGLRENEFLLKSSLS